MKEKLLIFKDKELDIKETSCLLLLMGLISGVFGFIYETIFYKIDLGYFVKRGSTFGPIIPIYFFGGILIILLSYKMRKSPIKIFLVNCMITGLLELVTGFIFDKVFNLRLWDYNTEIWNWGNINGYVCFRSYIFFGLASLLLIYAIVPMMLKADEKVSKKVITITTISLMSIFVIDIILHFVFSII